MDDSTNDAVVLSLARDLSEERCSADHYLWLLSGNGGFVVVSGDWASLGKAFVDQA